MKDWYFYQEHGKTMGPLTKEEVRARIVAGQLRLYDLLYFEGHDQWKMALEFPEFKDDFALSPHVPATGKSWVLLHRKTPEAKEFITSGPFTQSEVVEKIMAGKIQYTDYIWRDGFKQWKRINSIDEFVSQKGNYKADAQAKAVEKIMSQPAQELLTKVVQLKKVPVKTELLPPEATGSDLTKSKPPPLPTAISSEAAEARSLPPSVEREVVDPENFVEKRSQERRSKKNRRSKSIFAVMNWLDYALIAFIAITLGVGLFYVNRWKNKTPPLTVEFQSPHTQATETRTLEKPSEEAIIQTNEPDVTQMPAPTTSEAQDVAKEVIEEKESLDVAEEPVESKSSPNVEVKVAPGDLRVRAIVVGGKVEFSILSGSMEPVFVQIIGLPGQVLGVASFYKYFRLTPKENGLVTLDASKLILPAGQYVIRATRNDIVKQSKFNLGTNTPEFKKQIFASRKSASQSIWVDRLKLLKISNQLEVYIAQKVRQPKSKVKLNELSKLNSLKRSNGGQYVLFDYWWGMKEIFDKAQKEPSPAQLEQLLQVRRRLAQLTIWR